jgi:hypothetical protein
MNKNNYEIAGIAVHEVNCHVRYNKPNKNETVYDEFKINVFNIKEFNVYRRDDYVIADIHFKNTPMICIKLPLEMTDEEVLKFFKPLNEELDLISKKNRKK